MVQKQAGASSVTMLLIGMVAGAVLMALFRGLPEGVPGNVGSGLKNLISSNSDIPGEQVESTVDAAATDPENPVAFDFYEVLPDVGQVIMDDFPEASAERTGVEKKVVYMIQAASLRNESDADALRARLALEGYESAIQRVNVEGKGTYYRVRIGPYESRRTVKNEINRLRDIGISAMAVSLDAG